MAANIARRRRLQILGRLRVPRVILDRENPLEYLSEEDVFRRYRFRTATIYFILHLLPDLSRRTNRTSPLPAVLQLLVTLRFLATGSVHLLVAESVRISRSTAGRCIRTVAELLSRLVDRFIQFPTGIAAETTMRAFAAISGFPNVLGCVDGTHIKLVRPCTDEQDYVNRKGVHSLNVQMCCDPFFKIVSLNASWPGSVHDSRIFRQSGLCEQFENGIHRGLLLGDSGYACRYFFMVPFINPSSDAEERYNKSLCKTRVLIEQTFGILKRRFPVLNYIRTNPQRAVIYTTACVVLHNIGIEQGDIIDSEDLNVEDNTVPQVPIDQQDGVTMRRHLVNNFFT